MVFLSQRQWNGHGDTCAIMTGLSILEKGTIPLVLRRGVLRCAQQVFGIQSTVGDKSPWIYDCDFTEDLLFPKGRGACLTI
jgi:hypothetical protein